ncbi:MAG: hypothetical protein KC619_32045 [Myxococcales bacterium]|nr:hypothetical protein [Myxococcales bacterium]
MTGVLRVLLSTVFAVGLGGCFDCGRCIDNEIVLRVRSSTGGPVEEVTVSGLTQPAACTVEATETVCRSSIYYGDVTIVVGAPGFTRVSLPRSFPSPDGPNCSCEFHDLDEVVTLDPA